MPLALFAMWRGGSLWDVLVVLAVLGLGSEWAGMARMPAHRWPGQGVLLAPLLACLLCLAGYAGAGLGLLAVASLLLWLLPGGRRAAGGAAVHVGLAGVSLLWLRADPVAGRADLFFVMLLVWASDVGAYAVGRLVGGAKLAPAISPGKTRSGAIGGLLFSALAGAAAALAFGADAGQLGFAALVAGLLGAASQVGDLGESAVKRHYGVKDSGRLIPGHGGLLDRLDGVMLAAPPAALLALALGRGARLWE